MIARLWATGVSVQVHVGKEDLTHAVRDGVEDHLEPLVVRRGRQLAALREIPEVRVRLREVAVHPRERAHPQAATHRADLLERAGQLRTVTPSRKARPADRAARATSTPAFLAATDGLPNWSDDWAGMCFRGGILLKRPGTTQKISISVRPSDLACLRKRAKRLYGGNVSAVIAELAADAALLEGMHDLVDRLSGPRLTDEDRESLDREWAGRAPSSDKPSPKRKARKAA